MMYYLSIDNSGKGKDFARQILKHRLSIVVILVAILPCAVTRSLYKIWHILRGIRTYLKMKINTLVSSVIK